MYTSGLFITVAFIPSLSLAAEQSLDLTQTVRGADVLARFSVPLPRPKQAIALDPFDARMRRDNDEIRAAYEERVMKEREVEEKGRRGLEEEMDK